MQIITQAYVVYSLLAVLASACVLLSRNASRNFQVFHTFCATWALAGVLLCLSWCPIITINAKVDPLGMMIFERVAGACVLVLCVGYYRRRAMWPTAAFSVLCVLHLILTSLNLFTVLPNISTILYGDQFLPLLGFLYLIACHFVFSIGMLVTMSRLVDYVVDERDA